MNDKQIVDMLSDLIEELDYDIWKELFYYPQLDGEEHSVDEEVRIVKNHLKRCGIETD